MSKICISTSLQKFIRADRTPEGVIRETNLSNNLRNRPHAQSRVKTELGANYAGFCLIRLWPEPLSATFQRAVTYIWMEPACLCYLNWFSFNYCKDWEYFRHCLYIWLHLKSNGKGILRNYIWKSKQIKHKQQNEMIIYTKAL